MAKRFSGARLREAREAAGLTQLELARKLKLKGSTGKRADRTIQEWEAERSQPRADNLFRVARILKVTPDWLMVSETRKKVESSP